MPKGVKNPPLHLKMLSERYCFRSDDDGHDYLIKVSQQKEFETWLAAGPYWESYDGHDFQEDMIPGSVESFSFLNPVID
jgi:hypothetical protein